MDICKSHLSNHLANTDSEPVGQCEEDISDWSVLDIGTGNGLLLQELAKQGLMTFLRQLDKRSLLVMDKGILDAIGLHPGCPIKRIIYWDSVSRLVAAGGLLVIASCNSRKDELVEEVNTLNQRRVACQESGVVEGQEASVEPPPFRYLDHIRTYPTFTFGGSVSSRVATVAFLRN